MPDLLPDVDPDGLLEFSVVYTDRSLNHMSKKFITAMQDILGMLGEVYEAHTSAIVPGGGTYGMEAVARQFATDAKLDGRLNILTTEAWRRGSKEPAPQMY